MKKVLSLFVIAAMMLCMVCGCDSTAPQNADQKPPETVSACAPALDAIARGEFYEAYDLLLALGDNDEAKALLEHFAFVPKTLNYSGQTTTYTYDDNGFLATMTADLVNGTFENNEHGNVISAVALYNGKRQEVRYTYDEHGNTLSETHIEDGETETLTFTYDEHGNKLTEDRVWDGGFDKSTYTYDESGNMLTSENISLDNGKKQWSRHTYTYDENGNRLTNTVSDSDGDQRKYVFTYNEHNHVLTDVCITKDGKSETSYTYTYDENGNMLTKEEINKGGNVIKTTYTYDENGHTLTETTLSSNGMEDNIVNTFDQYGNPLTQKTTVSIIPDTYFTQIEWTLYYYENGVPTCFERFFPIT